VATEKELKLPADGTGSFSFWRGEAKRSLDWLKRLSEIRGWDDNLKAYLGKTLDALPEQDTIVVPKDFTLVEQKKALLFFQVPEVALTAQQPGLEGAVATFQAVLNRKLQSDEVNAAALMDEVLMDVLCPAGIGVSKIGYEAEVQGTVPVQQPAMDPMGQPIVDPMSGQPAMMTVDAPNIVNERYFWERVPVKDLILPPDFHGVDFDQAPYLGFRFKLDRAVAERVYGIDKEDAQPARGNESEGLLEGDVKPEPEKAPRITGYEIWYRASLYHADVANSECIYQLVWFEGQDEPSVHRKSPYQRVENGRVLQGMRGYPIHVLTLRYVSDQAVPPSDCSVSRPQVDELSAGRSEMVRQRKRARPINGYDPARLPKDAIDKIEAGEVQSFIPIPGFTAGGADSPVGPIQQASMSRENFTFNDYIDRDINTAWAIDSNQQGQQTQTRRTATELSIVNSASQTRMERERTQVARWFVRAVEKIGALVQLFADEQDYIEIVGQDGSRALQAWDKNTIQGRFAYSAKPDSTLRMDAAFDRKQAIDEFQFFRKDPLVNPQYLLQRTARRLGMDPQQFIAPPQPPQQPPPNFGVSIKGEDLIPFAPQYPAVLAYLSVANPELAAKLPPPQANPLLPPPAAPGPAAAAPNPPHGGMAPMMQPMSKHQEQQTGQLPGAGRAPAQGMMPQGGM
jgi:hypothetical protein